MTKCRVLIIILFAFVGKFTLAQQQEHYSMYMQNNFLVNPAEGGTEEFVDAKLGHRTQWVNFGTNDIGGPRTFVLSGHSPLKKRVHEFEELKQLPFHGVGGVITMDAIGPFNILTVKGAYAYHLPVTKSLVLSVGTFIGLKQYSISGSSLQSSSDPTVVDPWVSGFQNAIVPDLTLGIWGYAKDYYFGIASFQLLNTDVKLYSSAQTSQSNLATHHWATAGYKIHITEGWFVVPSIVAKYVKNTPFTFDLNAKLRYQDLYWGGISYRLEDAVVVLAGVTLKKKIDIGYSFDFTTSDISKYSSGTHELVVGYRFSTHLEGPPPAQFW